MKIYIALDSGAFSMFRRSVIGQAKEKKNPLIKNKAQSVSAKLASRARAGDDYYSSEEYRNYLEEYVTYVKEHRRKLDYYVTLDAMYDAPRTWESMQELEQHGLKPMPVFHYGEDLKWLRKYVRDHNYIGVGGIARRVSPSRRMAFLRQVFAITHADAGSEFKLHGFGLTSADLMRELPWYSVDSYSPLLLANNGKLQMPAIRMRHGKFVGFDYTHAGPIVYMTSRLAEQRYCFANTPKRYQHVIAAFLEQIDLKPKDLYDPDIPHGDKGTTLGWALVHRVFANLYSYAKTAEAISAQRGSLLRLYFSGSIGGNEISKCMSSFFRAGLQEFRWLGTHFDSSTIDTFLERGWCKGMEYSQRPKTKKETT